MPYSPDELADLVAEMVSKLDTVIASGILSATWDIPIGFVSSPDPDEVIDSFMVATAFTLKAGMPGAIGRVETNPTATYVVTIRSGGTRAPASGTAVGTITVSTAGVVSFATAGGVDVAVPVGLLKFVAPNPLDAGISGFAATLKV
jgi:hypothetical protein